MAKLTEYIKTFFMIIILLQFAPPILKSIKQQWVDNLEPKNLVGLITFNQPIYSSHQYIKELQKYFKDPEIKAILLKMDCPGGASGASQAIALEILQLKKDYPKPIITYSENLCASGAYYIAAMTDHIITTGSCIVGNIGSKLCTQFKLKEFLHDYKIETLSISSGSCKNVFDPFTDVNEEQIQMLQQLSDDTYAQFVTDITKQRHVPLQNKDAWANGKIFTGVDALKLKLIDAIGNQTTALDYIKQNILHSDREISFVKSSQPSALKQWLNPEDDTDDSAQCSLSESFWSGLIQVIKKSHF